MLTFHIKYVVDVMASSAATGQPVHTIMLRRTIVKGLVGVVHCGGLLETVEQS